MKPEIPAFPFSFVLTVGGETMQDLKNWFDARCNDEFNKATLYKILASARTLNECSCAYDDVMQWIDDAERLIRLSKGGE